MWNKTINRIGEEFITNKGYTVKIIDYKPHINCTIQFMDGTILRNITYQNLQKGEIRHPNQPTICNIGYIGVGSYTSSINNKDTKVYITWNHMLKRCYDTKCQILQPSYTDCTVAEEWHNFQNFANWYETNYVEGFELDKDIIVRGNKEYSPDTCCFVPREINVLFTCRKQNINIKQRKDGNISYKVVIKADKKVIQLGTYYSINEALNIYGKAKQAHIKILAERYKAKLKPSIYNILINYIWK